MTRLAHHRAIVTGAGSGIGKSIALRLAEEGANVVVNDIDHDAAETTAEAIKDAGGTALASTGDVTRPSDINQALLTARVQLPQAFSQVSNA